MASLSVKQERQTKGGGHDSLLTAQAFDTSSSRDSAADGLSVLNRTECANSLMIIVCSSAGILGVCSPA